MGKKIIFTVTNDLRFDQRMERICGSLSRAGYEVLLTGRKKRNSPALIDRSYRQKRLSCFFQKGKLFYAEYNFRLFFFLLFSKADCFCAIDLDTILPVFWASRIKGVRRVYDAHEYFSQMEEVISRPAVYRVWHLIERKMIPRFPHGYTVGHQIASRFEELYGVHYEVIRNLPYASGNKEVEEAKEKFILYQGAVNKGRSLTELIKAMKQVAYPLWICGDGNAMQKVKAMVNQLGMEDRVHFTGMLSPEALKNITQSAYIGVNPFERKGLNQYYSLANKFFDYIQAGIPQVTMDYPEYREINEEFGVAMLISEPDADSLAAALNNLAGNAVLYSEIRDNCMKAKLELVWEKEQEKLIRFYSRLFSA